MAAKLLKLLLLSVYKHENSIGTSIVLLAFPDRSLLSIKLYSLRKYAKVDCGRLFAAQSSLLDDISGGLDAMAKM